MTRHGWLLVVAALAVLGAGCGEEGEWSEEVEADYLESLYGEDGEGLTAGKALGKADSALAVPRGVLALTFDDGPHPTRTAAVMDVLEAHGTTGVFFQLGQAIEAHPEVTAQVAARGHHVANHCYQHKFMPDHDSATLEGWLVKTRDLIGQHARGHFYLRPPYGGINQRVRGIIEGLGYKVVMWNIDTLDWDFADGSTRFEWVPALFREDFLGWVNYHARSVGGGVALFHDVHDITAKNLDLILRCWSDPDFYWSLVPEPRRSEYLAYYQSHGVDPYLAFTFADLNSYHWPAFLYEDGEQLDPVAYHQGNKGWIGGLCEVDAECMYEGAVCLREGGAAEGPGICSKSCTKYCPDDPSDPLHYQTFCVEVLPEEGHCLPKCSAVIPCPEGHECRLENRFGDIETATMVCLPADSTN